MSQAHYTPDGDGSPESLIPPQECSRILQISPHGIFKFTPEGRLLYANQAFARMLGYDSPTEVLEAVSDIARQLYVDPRDREEIQGLLQEQGQLHGHECLMLRKDGSRVWISFSAETVKDLEDKTLHYFGFTSEITERKRAEETLRQASYALEERVKELECLYGLSRLMDQTAVSSQELMQSVVELIPSGLQYPDIACARMLLEDVTFESPGFQETAWKHAADIVISGNKAGRIEVFYLQKVSEAEGSPFLREERQLIESIAERLGKTLERIQNKEALRRSQQKFRSLVENADAIIYSQTPDGYLTYLSPRFTELLGHEVQDYIGRHVSELLHPEDYPLAQRHLSDLLKTGQRHSKVEIRLLHKEGGCRWFTVNTSPQSYAHAKIESIMGVAHDITERKQAEEQLRESEERFRALVEGAPDAMFVQTEQKFAYLNPQALELFGARQESELLGQPILDRVHSDFKDMGVDRIRRLNEERQPVQERFEVKFLRLDGKEVWVETTGQPITYQGKEGALVFVRDISERKQAEEKLRYQEQLLETIVNNTWDILSIKNPDFTLERYNQAGYQFLGLAPEEVHGRKCFELIGRDRKCNPCAANQALQRGESLKIEKFVPELGVYLDCRSTPVLDEEGKVIKVVDHLRDITEHKLAEKRLEEEFNLRNALLDNIPYCVALILKKGTREIVASNRAAQELGAVPGKTCFQTCAFREDPCPFCRASELWKTGQLQQIEVEYRGSWYKGIWAPLSNELYVHYIFDITERKKAEQEKEQLRMQMLQSQKMQSLGVLAAGVAHEFNNLLQVMSGNIQLLLMRKTDQDPDLRYLESVRTAANRAALFVKELLLFSRSSSTNKKLVDLCDGVQKAINLLEQTLPRMIQVTFSQDEDLWPIYADPVQVEQVVLNLCTNAADAMSEGGLISIEARNVYLGSRHENSYLEVEPGDYVLLRLQDTGQGMDAKTQEQMFEPFFTTKEVGQGTGLGLSTVYGIVQSHAGHIQCSSTPGQGTAISIYWPAGKSEEISKVQEQEKLEERIQGGNETILVVDDEETCQDVLGETLGRYGYTVLVASSGEEALSIYFGQEQKIDLVILDLSMPGMGGRQCLLKMLARDPGAKVLVASGYFAESKGQEMLQLGAAGFISKPFQLAELMFQVQEVLSLH